MHPPADPFRAAQKAEALRAARLRRRRRAALVSFALAATTAVALAPDGASPPRGGPDPGASVVEPVAGTAGDPQAAPASSPAPAEEDRAAADAALRRRVEAARRFAEQLPGAVSFAIASDGVVRGYRQQRQYPSASVVKAMLLAAEMWRLQESGEDLDPATRTALTAMITFSDNEAADLIYARVGDEGLREVAARVGLERFEVAESWGYAQITAADMALLFSQLDLALPSENREFAKGLLGAVVPAQSWGIPAATGDAWAVRFKGGWRPTDSGQLVHQAAELHDGERELSLAVLTDGQTSMAAGIEAIEGIAARLVPGAESG